ncbi:hypothetical protein [Halocalculus aciditolerans]|uniref:Uncharacterized protein n=1 Tax=Halocalculus aciditolerans TaxID=1383812 RepID=A0A830FA54_9EURY|nr:hypothetical protein [Halocalculus aciditolerans]GGL55069.1 hypothetical protein GCM10009039_11440 [Halocalculus aciditolerans]
MTKPRDRRVHLALKWRYLDNLDVDEIQDRFRENGYGDYAPSTIRKYLNEQPKEEVIEQIEKKHADVRLQIAEREEEMYKRAREAESQAVEDQPRKRVVPATSRVSQKQTPFYTNPWEVLDADDDRRPEWATPEDIIIVFDEDEEVMLDPGEKYPIREFDGSPKYTTSFAGLDRDEPDLRAKQSARQEQTQHLQAKGEILGAYEQNINISGELDTETEISLDEDLEEGVLEAVREAQKEDAAE